MRIEKEMEEVLFSSSVDHLPIFKGLVLLFQWSIIVGICHREEVVSHKRVLMHSVPNRDVPSKNCRDTIFQKCLIFEKKKISLFQKCPIYQNVLFSHTLKNVSFASFSQNCLTLSKCLIFLRRYVPFTKNVSFFRNVFFSTMSYFSD